MHNRKYILLSVCSAVLLAGATVLTGCGAKEESAVAGSSDLQVESVAASSEEESTDIQFPYELEDGKLVIQSLFQSSIENPDAGNALGEDVASLEIVNNSDEFIQQAAVTVALENGTQIFFEGTNIPAGKKAWLFAKGNDSIDVEPACAEITYNITYGEASVMEDRIQTSVDDTVITLQNITEEDIYNVTIGCHCLFDEQYFGGLTYNYPVEVIPAGGTVTVDAADCYLGIPEIVFIQ